MIEDMTIRQLKASTQHKSAPPRRRWGAPRRARAPPIDYGDGLSSSLNNPQATDITIFANRALSARAALVAIDRNSWSRSVGMGGRDRRYAHRKVQVGSLYRLKAQRW